MYLLDYRACEEENLPNQKRYVKEFLHKRFNLPRKFFSRYTDKTLPASYSFGIQTDYTVFGMGQILFHVFY